MEALCKDGLRSTSGRSLPKGYGLATTRREWGRPALDLWSLATEGTQERPEAISPGHRPGYRASAANALQGQKHFYSGDSFALSGRTFVQRFNPGRCPELTASAPLGRFDHLRRADSCCPSFPTNGRLPVAFGAF